MGQPKRRLSRAERRRRKFVPVNSAVRIVIVDDPYEPGAKLPAAASIRDDPLGRLHDRKQIDDAQYHAGREYQRLCEQAAIVPLKAMDTTKEPVDGGGAVRDPYSDGKRKAMKKLQELSIVLGKDGEALLRYVLIDRLFFGQIAGMHGHKLCDRIVNYFGIRFRECLETLAIELNLAAPKRKVGS